MHVKLTIFDDVTLNLPFLFQTTPTSSSPFFKSEARVTGPRVGAVLKENLPCIFTHHAAAAASTVTALSGSLMVRKGVTRKKDNWPRQQNSSTRRDKTFVVEEAS